MRSIAVAQTTSTTFTTTVGHEAAGAAESEPGDRLGAGDRPHERKTPAVMRVRVDCST